MWHAPQAVKSRLQNGLHNKFFVTKFTHKSEKIRKLYEHTFRKFHDLRLDEQAGVRQFHRICPQFLGCNNEHSKHSGRSERFNDRLAQGLAFVPVGIGLLLGTIP